MARPELEVADIFRDHGPAWRRAHAGHVSLGQLKVMQEVITLTVFVPFAVLYMNQAIRLDFLWAALCLLGAVYFTFRS